MSNLDESWSNLSGDFDPKVKLWAHRASSSAVEWLTAFSSLNEELVSTLWEDYAGKIEDGKSSTLTKIEDLIYGLTAICLVSLKSDANSRGISLSDMLTHYGFQNALSILDNE